MFRTMTNVAGQMQVQVPVLVAKETGMLDREICECPHQRRPRRNRVGRALARRCHISDRCMHLAKQA
jgi:hypothetical protein